MKKKFAFMLMAPHYDPAKDHAVFETPKQFTFIVSVNNFDEACEKCLELAREGVGAIELCGAFGPEKAEKISAILGKRVAVGYVICAPDQAGLFADFFKR